MNYPHKPIQQIIDDLKLAEDRFYASIEFAPFGMILTNRDGNIELVNKLIEFYFGYDRSELLGQKIEVLLPQSARKKHESFREDYNNQPSARNMGVGRDLFARRKDGSQFPVEVGLSPIKTKDGFQILAAVVDITERKSIEDKVLHYAEELEISNRELQDFAMVTSHDLQEPLRKILSFSDFLMINEKEKLSETGQDYLKRMHSAAGRMKQLIHDILMLSRVTTAAKPFEDVNLKAILQNVLQDFDLKIEEAEAGINIATEHSIKADASQIGQLMQNLISNALKYKAADRKPIIHITSEMQNKTCHIRVSDNGIGFDPKYAEQIFMPFKRLHERKEYEGTGIGLAVCRKIVERHKGTIAAESEPGKGSTFIISLPQSKYKQKE